jgi:2-polyprenyl-6-methoxyphenol hydroxylase-like FAD-dependent oxidoreductase
MLKIAIVGGGPAGLLFAKLMKQQNPAHCVDVFEQNPADNTYGFGVVFTDTALRFLEEADPDLLRDIVAAAEHQDHITIVHQDQPTSVKGNVFYGIARVRLLNILQQHCLRLGTNIRFGERIDNIERLAGYDVIVGADGVNSLVRESLNEHFQARKEERINKWAWYATPKHFAGVSLIFKMSEAGLFIGHNYRFSADMGGFVVECDPETWRRAVLDTKSDEESRRYCAEVFRDYLDGEPFLSNRSLWFNPSFVTSKNWYWRNVVLIGDALKTVHPSIGSGTRVGMQDALALATAFKAKGEDVQEVYPEYVRIRKPGSDGFQSAAMRSILWYESVMSKMHLDPVNFSFSFMMRTGKVNYERLRMMDPAYVAAYEYAPSSFLQPRTVARGMKDIAA